MPYPPQELYPPLGMTCAQARKPGTKTVPESPAKTFLKASRKPYKPKISAKGIKIPFAKKKRSRPPFFEQNASLGVFP